ncbi:hypothetical protein VTJ49DRAFT_3316 [Mycothermus thermophilus]|uniref:Uncharacterized protein n=1 Tax=Humicola insolens TaxID=85995 RepID=A0ABR3V9Q3_HUMIN
MSNPNIGKVPTTDPLLLPISASDLLLEAGLLSKVRPGRPDSQSTAKFRSGDGDEGGLNREAPEEEEEEEEEEDPVSAIRMGCPELDEHVLLGGMGKGEVVGMALQTMAHLLATDPLARAMVVTTLPASALLPSLRTALLVRLSSTCLENRHHVHVRVIACLKRIDISRVFDVEGLLEVLGELDGDSTVAPPRTETGQEMPAEHVSEDRKERQPPPPPPLPPPPEQKRQQRTEVRDSEDESSLSSSPLSSPPASPLLEEPQEQPQPTRQIPTPMQREPAENTSRLPDLILVTHTSTLLNALFTTRDKPAAHDTMVRLAACLRALVRPPSFGQVFSKLLDLHLLCTRTGAAAAAPGVRWAVEVLKDEVGVYEYGNEEEDERAAGADGGGRNNESNDISRRHNNRRIRRRCREKRWGVVDVVVGGRVVNAEGLEGRP